MKNEMITQKIKPFKSIAHSIVMIECTLPSRETRKGTGFIYEFCNKEDGRAIQAIVTNKHLVRDAKWTHIRFTKKKEDGTPDHGNQVVTVCTDFWASCVPHPDPKTDLCIYPLNGLMKKAEREGIAIYIPPLGSYRTPTEKEMRDTDTVEEIYVVGYPNGLLDSENNEPIYRKGITATDINLNYCDRRQFLVDTGIFQGSSGSPVFMVVNEVSLEDNRYVLVKRMRLVGIVGFVLIHSNKGVVRTLAFEDMPVDPAATQTQNYLGVAIHYSKLLEFEELLTQPNQVSVY
ncbi:S1 family peptidase [Larkinella terrae]|uniref:Serine protease n=1 Tax=Larkinella terrae TaxID=2025311 RepID=A0A7K0EFM2_9BACT|nr:serine protease [Larkinella terrae]MRS60371.1 hypothetical protein [Larkinella terrae]